MQIDKLRGKQLDELFEAILSLETREECYQLFNDLATMNEITALTERFQVAKMLTEGNTYSAVEKETKASTAAISRVRRCIDYGSRGDGRVFERLGADGGGLKVLCI